MNTQQYAGQLAGQINSLFTLIDDKGIEFIKNFGECEIKREALKVKMNEEFYKAMWIYFKITEWGHRFHQHKIPLLSDDYEAGLKYAELIIKRFKRGDVVKNIF